jgi:hypothetical protein
MSKLTQITNLELYFISGKTAILFGGVFYFGQAYLSVRSAVPLRGRRTKPEMPGEHPEQKLTGIGFFRPRCDQNSPKS